MKNAEGFPLGDGFTFAVGTGGGGDVAGTIVYIYPQKTSLYAALGTDDLTIRLAILSRRQFRVQWFHTTISKPCN